MFIGHYAVGFASKRFAPRGSLGIMVAAATFLDLLWPFFLLLGWEKVRIEPGNNPFLHFVFISYPISHSLLASAIWATLFAVCYFLWARFSAGAIVLWLGVISLWVLDFATHRPDLPLYPAGPKVGLGLWNSPFWTIVIEGLIFLAGSSDVHASYPSEKCGGEVGLLVLRRRANGLLHTEHRYSATT